MKAKGSNLITKLESPSLQTLARNLGHERRKHARVAYPARTTATLPSIRFQDQGIRIHDISEGGVCLLDEKDILGSNVGNEVLLHMLWHKDDSEPVRSRIVARGAHRRHIQFLDFSEKSAKRLREAMRAGLAAHGMNQALAPMAFGGPLIEALELWHAPTGETLVLREDVHRLAELRCLGHDYILFKRSWPKRADNLSQSIPVEEFFALILFVSNIPTPTPLVKNLLAELESVALEVHE